MARFVVIDSETTGLSQYTDRMVEFAMIEVVDGQFGRRWQSYFNPGIPCRAEAQAIHGISDEVILAAPTFAEKWPEIKEFIDFDTVVAHSAKFDIEFLLTEISHAPQIKHEQDDPEGDAEYMAWYAFLQNHYCTRNLAKSVWSDMSCKLVNVCAVLDIPWDAEKAHGAMYDAEQAATVFCKLALHHKIPL